VSGESDWSSRSKSDSLVFEQQHLSILADCLSGLGLRWAARGLRGLGVASKPNGKHVFE
jgi:hypothetical protein